MIDSGIDTSPDYQKFESTDKQLNPERRIAGYFLKIPLGIIGKGVDKLWGWSKEGR